MSSLVDYDLPFIRQWTIPSSGEPSAHKAIPPPSLFVPHLEWGEALALDSPFCLGNIPLLFHWGLGKQKLAFNLSCLVPTQALGGPVLWKVHSLRKTNLFLVFNRCLWSGPCLHIWFHYLLLFPSNSHTACLFFVEHPKHDPATGPLHLHFLLPGMLFPWSAWLNLNVTSLRGLLGTNLQ